MPFDVRLDIWRLPVPGHTNFIRTHSFGVLASIAAGARNLAGVVGGDRRGQSDAPALALLVTLAAGTCEAASSRLLALIAGGLAALTFGAVIAARWFRVESAAQVQWIFLSIFFAFAPRGCYRRC